MAAWTRIPNCAAARTADRAKALSDEYESKVCVKRSFLLIVSLAIVYNLRMLWHVRLHKALVGLIFGPLLIGCAVLSQAPSVVLPSSPSASDSTKEPASPIPVLSGTPLPTIETPAPSATLTPVLPDPASATWQLVVDGLASPVDMESLDDGRLFVVEQRGTIVVYQDGRLIDTPFLDIRGRVNTNGNERGLLGLAFDPAFSQNGLFYVDYTGSGGDTYVSRLHADPESNQADPSSEQILLHIRQPYANHNGGHLAFGPDGYLYIGMGDGGSAGDPQGNGQSLSTLLGKLLRIDVRNGDTYSIPADNPFVNVKDARPELWAYGLRNPWRFSFDAATGDLYIGDVGQNQWEEVDYQPAGAPGGQNYGWSIREGFHEYKGQADGLTEPAVEYSHSDGCSISGGVVVRDPALPAWQGVYVYGDFCSGYVWGLLGQPDGTWLNSLLFQTSASITGFGTDAIGQVYLIDRNGGLYRLAPAA
jgi:glucose/arabinose dehydrogenase